MKSVLFINCTFWGDSRSPLQIKAKMALFGRNKYSIKLNGVKYSMRRGSGLWNLTADDKPIGLAKMEITRTPEKTFFNVTIRPVLLAGRYSEGLLFLFGEAAGKLRCDHVRIFVKPAKIGKAALKKLDARLGEWGYRFCSFFSVKYFEKRL